MEPLAELKVNIPWWYRIFIRFMPNFWLDLPKERTDVQWTTSVLIAVPFVLSNVYTSKKKKGQYKSLQKAYLRARWRAMWTDFFHFSNEREEIMWQVLQLNKEEMKD